MIPNLWSSGALVVAVWLSSWATAAPSKIPYSVVTANTALSRDQVRHLELYLDDAITRLVRGSDEQVVRARRDLIEPLNWAGSTDIFRLAYASAAANRLGQGMKSDQLLVRLNTMIVVNAINDPGTIMLIEKGLADPNPAVRYWAAKAISQTFAGKLAHDEQQRLLESLAAAMQTEQSERVLQRLLVAVVGLNIPDAATQLLEGLNKRVTLHAANPNMPLGAALEGLRTLFVKTVEAKANGQDPPVSTIRLMAIVAYRYLDLSAALLDLNRPSTEHRAHYRQMITLDDAILRWTVRQMPPEGGAELPPSIKSDVAAENWPLVRLRAEEWKRVLAQAPFGFGPVDLMITIPDRP